MAVNKYEVFIRYARPFVYPPAVITEVWIHAGRFSPDGKRPIMNDKKLYNKVKRASTIMNVLRGDF